MKQSVSIFYILLMCYHLSRGHVQINKINNLQATESPVSRFKNSTPRCLYRLLLPHSTDPLLLVLPSLLSMLMWNSMSSLVEEFRISDHDSRMDIHI